MTSLKVLHHGHSYKKRKIFCYSISEEQNQIDFSVSDYLENITGGYMFTTIDTLELEHREYWGGGGGSFSIEDLPNLGTLTPTPFS